VVLRERRGHPVPAGVGRLVLGRARRVVGHARQRTGQHRRAGLPALRGCAGAGAGPLIDQVAWYAQGNTPAPINSNEVIARYSAITGYDLNTGTERHRRRAAGRAGLEAAKRARRRGSPHPVPALRAPLAATRA
jgi:hypothetical protein